MKFSFTLVLALISVISFAGGGNEHGGARVEGMAGTSLTQVDVWSTTNNIGALGLQDKFAVGASFQSRYFLPEAALKSVALAAPLGGGTIGLVGHQFGYAAFSDNRVGLGYARKLSDYLSLGVQMNYLNVRIGHIYGNRSTLTAEVGLLIMPTDNIRLGVHVYNPTRSKLADFDDERVPSYMALAGQYIFSEKVSGIIQVEKGLDDPINIITGLEYNPVESIFIRTGYATAKGIASFGFGYQWKELNADVSAQWHQTLGFSSGITLSYQFGKRKAQG